MELLIDGVLKVLDDDGDHDFDIVTGKAVDMHIWESTMVGQTLVNIQMTLYTWFINCQLNMVIFWHYVMLVYQRLYGGIRSFVVTTTFGLGWVGWVTYLASGFI